MKKLISIILVLVMLLAFVGCSGKTYNIKIAIPAGSTEQIVYSDEEISPTRNSITVIAGEDCPDTEVFLKTVYVKEENVYDEPIYITHGMPVKIDAEKGAWFKIGVGLQNPTDENITVTLRVKNINVRISCS